MKRCSFLSFSKKVPLREMKDFFGEKIKNWEGGPLASFLSIIDATENRDLYVTGTACSSLLPAISLESTSNVSPLTLMRSENGQREGASWSYRRQKHGFTHFGSIEPSIRS